MTAKLDTLRDLADADAGYNIWIHLADADALRHRAARLPTSGPLAGMTFAVKDNIDVAGMPTTAACPSFAYAPAEDAPVTACLHAAGALCVGKTNLDQFATGLVGTRSPYGACRNSQMPEYISGGSSSGSAVAVARGHVDAALGTDTAGSGRVPAAFNGLIGLKPTRGLLSTRGVVPACASLDCVSLFTRDVATARRVLPVLAGEDPDCIWSRTGKQAGTPAAPWRIGVVDPERLFFDGDASAKTAYEEAVTQWRDLGHLLVEVDPDAFLAAARLLYEGPWVNERALAVGDFLRQGHPDFDPVVRAIILNGERGSARELFSAQYQLQARRHAAEGLWREMDLLMLPTAPTCYRLDQVAADPVKTNSRLGTYTNFVNLLDLAAVAVPSGRLSSGVPTGVTLHAPAFSDEFLLDAAAHFLGEAPAQTRGMAQLAVVGAHLRGLPLQSQLQALGARFLREAQTAPAYRLFRLPGAVPAKPGMIRDQEQGQAIAVEIYELSEAAFGAFVQAIPPPLGIGTLTLADGSSVKGFLCEPEALKDAEEITAYGGWRAYLAAQ